MSATLSQIYALNPTTTIANTDLLYLVQSPYTPGTDAGILGSDLKALFVSSSAIINSAHGGTGVNNGTSTITVGGNVTYAGAFTFTGTLTGNTSVTFPTSGTLATTSQIPTGAALTKTDDTNVTLSLGGSPATALINAASLALGWTGQLAVGRGGTGNNTFTAFSVICAGTTATGAFQNVSGLGSSGNVLTSNGAGTLPTWQALPGVTGAALTKTDDTNVTLSLGGSPSTALVNAASLTLGWTGQLGLTRGGTNASLTASNGGMVYSTGSALAILGGTATANQLLLSGASTTPAWSTLTHPATCALGDTLYGSATNVLTMLAGNITSVKQYLSQTGTGVISAAPAWATIAGADITGAALTKADDTNVTLSLGGTPATALLRAASLSLGWTGLLSGTRGGTGVNNGASTITIGGSVTFSGAFTFSGTITANTTVTFPTTGTLATTSQIPTGAALTKTDDTNVTLSLGGSPSSSLLAATSLTLGWTGQLGLTRGGTNASLTASTGGIVYSGASALAILSGTSTATQMLQSGASAAPAWSTSTWPATTTINQLLYSSANNVVSGLSTSNSAFLVTSASGVPSWNTNLAFVRTNLVKFTVTGTYTPTTGMQYVWMRAVGNGAGGGGTNSSAGNTCCGGGGGSGGYSELVATAATIGASQTVTIGATGTGGTSGTNNGVAGGDVSVGTLLIAKGGSPGTGGTSGTSGGTGGAGGVAGTGDVTIPGNAGGSGLNSTATTTSLFTGRGAASHFGGAPLGATTTTTLTGAGGGNYGAGGNGGMQWNNGGAAGGGAGSTGIALILEFIYQ